MKCWKAELLIACLVCSPSVFSQTAKKAIEPKSPELKIRIIPSKGTYSVGEKMFSKTEFTNLTDKVLCFPDPDQDEQYSMSGYLITYGTAVATGEGEEFIRVVDGRSKTHEELLQQVKEKWVKLAPNALYTTESARVHARVKLPGEWRLTATYHPPEGYGSGYREFMQSVAGEVGCRMPIVDVSAEPVVVNVVPPPNTK